jgi:hypothetical protein
MDEHFILEIDNFLPEHVCNEMVKRFESDPNKRVSKIGVASDDTGGFYDLSRRNSKEMIISNKPEWKDIDKIVNATISKAVRIYKQELAKKLELIGEDPNFQMIYLMGNSVEDTGYMLQRVEKNSWYRWHHDHTYDDRILNIIIYLNTLDESEGGRTEFIHGRKVFPKVGKLLIFPTTWTNVHCGSWVTNYKYICTTSLFRRI